MAETAPAAAVTTAVSVPAAKERPQSLKAPVVEAAPATEEKAKVEEAPATEEKAKVEEATNPKPDEKRRADRFAKLAREENAIRTERERLKADADKLTIERKALSDKLERWDRREKLESQAKLATPEGRDARTNLLKEFGVEFGTLARDVVEGNKVDPRDLVKSELEQFKADFAKQQEEAEQKRQAAAQAQNINQQVLQVKAHIKQLAIDSGDKFELVREEGAIDDVWDLMVKSHKANRDLTFLEALAKCEEDLIRQHAELHKRSPKLRGLVSPKAEEKASKQKSETLKVTREPESRPVGKLAASDAGLRGDFNPKKHVNDLLARHKARMGT